tara:strand:- start:21271 stop:21864 length:594 start_codon:yes stop_codon:yes gene_type:complete
MGAGILPIALYRGTIFLLLGQERHNSLLCDFGGSPHKEEQIIDTAVREGCEELNGLLGDKEMVDRLVKSNLILMINDSKYTSYIFNIKYDKNLPYYFNNLNRFAESYLSDKINEQHNGLFEKKKIEWYKLDELKNKNLIGNVRPHYINILNSITRKEIFLKNELRKRQFNTGELNLEESKRSNIDDVRELYYVRNIK